MPEIEPDLQIEYRLTWEMVVPSQSYKLETKYGRNIWSRMTDDDLAKCTWEEVSRVSDDLIDIADQRATLEMWEQNRDQPVRNIRFERRPALCTEVGWTSV